MQPDIGAFMRRFGRDFKIIRDGKEIMTVKGLTNKDEGTNKEYIGFYPDTKVNKGDCAICSVSDEKYYIYDIKKDVKFQKIFQIKGYYRREGECESNATDNISTATYNIENAYNSIIGNQNEAVLVNNISLESINKLIEEKGGSDVVELKKIINDLHSELSSHNTLSKGFLTKYSDLIAKHGWISGPIAQLIIGWFMGGA